MGEKQTGLLSTIVQAVKTTRLSCHRFRSNQVRLWPGLIACNLGNLWPGRPSPGREPRKKIKGWSPTSFEQRLVKTGGRVAGGR
jgi:hypothetical protein